MKASERERAAKGFCVLIEAEYLGCNDEYIRIYSVNGNFYKVLWKDYKKNKNNTVWLNSWKMK